MNCNDILLIYCWFDFDSLVFGGFSFLIFCKDEVNFLVRYCYWFFILYRELLVM